MRKLLVLFGAGLMTVTGCAVDAPKTVQACEFYFIASDRVEDVVDLYFDDLGALSSSQRLSLATEYEVAIRRQLGKAFELKLAMSSEGLDQGDFGSDVQQLESLLESQKENFLSGDTDVVVLLQIQRLETSIANHCGEIGAGI